MARSATQWPETQGERVVFGETELGQKVLKATAYETFLKSSKHAETAPSWLLENGNDFVVIGVQIRRSLSWQGLRAPQKSRRFSSSGHAGVDKGTRVPQFLVSHTNGITEPFNVLLSHVKGVFQ